MDSPLSDINEVIADSEDEITNPVDNGTLLVKDLLSKELDKRESLGNQDGFPIADGNQAHILQNDLDFGEPYVPPVPIDYFAGFQDTDPTPSIADRAKTRKRKLRMKPTQDILDLTDGEADVSPKPQRSKPQSKPTPRGKGKQSSSGATGANVDSNPPLTSLAPMDSTLVVNAKSRTRPRPVKKSIQPPPPPPEMRTSQSTLAVPTSPFPSVARQSPPNPSLVDLPPSDPPLPSSILMQDLDLPPIEVLPQPESTCSDLTSSLYQVGADEPRKRKKQLQRREDADELEENHDSQPPPTFFAGSSSHPRTNGFAISDKRTSLHSRASDYSLDVVDLTALPSSPGAPPETERNSKKDEAVKTKVVKSRKKEETKNSAGLDEKKSRKRKQKQKVEVMVSIPRQKEIDPSVPNLKTPVRKGKEKAESNVDQDELNIDVNCNTSIGFEPQEQPTPSTSETGNLPQENMSPHEVCHETTSNARSRKPRGRKRKSDIAGIDSSSAVVADELRKVGDTPQPLLSKGLESRKSKRRKEKINDGNDLSTTIVRNKKGKGKMALLEDEDDFNISGNVACDGSPSRKETKTVEEHNLNEFSQDNTHQNGGNESQDILRDIKSENNTSIATKRHETPSVGKYPNLSSRYTLAPRTQSPSISELIRRVNSQPNSPFAAAPSRRSSYSPYFKSSRTALSRIAPLHPNRHTPPPQPPPPPPKKKSKKELELEEKWEEDVIEEIGGISEWLALSESDKKELKRRKRDREMGYCED